MLRVVNNKVFTLIFTSEINSSKIRLIVFNWKNVYLHHVFVDCSEASEKLLFKLLFR